MDPFINEDNQDPPDEDVEEEENEKNGGTVFDKHARLEHPACPQIEP